SPRRGRPQRELISQVIGPVWEANHIWLIFVLVLLWTAFPAVFAAVMSTMYIPLTLAAVGIIGRGCAFAFRKVVYERWQRRLFGGVFAGSSILTPFFMGTVAGGIASGRVPAGLAAGNLVTSWLNPTSILGGVLAVGACAYLAAMYLCHDAERVGRPDLAAVFRRRALATAVVVGAVVLGGIAVLHADAPALFHWLIARALPLVVLSTLAGLTSVALLVAGRYVLVRPAAALAVATVVWGWALAQYPRMLPPDLDYATAAASHPVLAATPTVVGVGSLLVLPSLGWLFSLFQRGRPAAR